MATIEIETKTPEVLREEIGFLLNRIDDVDFLTALRLLAGGKASSTNAATVKGMVTWESIPEELRKAIEEGERDIAEGRVYTTEEVFREIDECLEKP